MGFYVYGRAPWTTHAANSRSTHAQDESWSRKLTRRLQIPRGTLMHWIRQGTVRARQLDEPLHLPRWGLRAVSLCKDLALRPLQRSCSQTSMWKSHAVRLLLFAQIGGSLVVLSSFFLYGWFLPWGESSDDGFNMLSHAGAWSGTSSHR